MIICFGANDGAKEGAQQHVPVDKYKKNLKTIIEMARENPRFGDADIIVMTPPLPDESMIDEKIKDYLKAGTINEEDAKLEYPRPMEDMAKYAKAVRDLVKEIRKQDKAVEIADVWKAMEGKVARELLFDGLHFSKGGYQVSFLHSISHSL